MCLQCVCVCGQYIYSTKQCVKAAMNPSSHVYVLITLSFKPLWDHLKTSRLLYPQNAELTGITFRERCDAKLFVNDALLIHLWHLCYTYGNYGESESTHRGTLRSSSTSQPDVSPLSLRTQQTCQYLFTCVDYEWAPQDSNCCMVCDHYHIFTYSGERRLNRGYSRM